MKLYDEYHEYRVDTQRWQKWPKALIMTHEWSTNGNDRRTEQRRYVPDNYATQLETENAKLRELVSHLVYVKPAQVTAITHDGKLFRFDEKLAEVGMRYEAES